MQKFIKITADLLASEVYKDANTFKVYVWLMMNQNYADGTVLGVDIKKGEVLISRKVLAEKTGLSGKTAYACVRKLEELGYITVKKSGKVGLVITVIDKDSKSDSISVKEENISLNVEKSSPDDGKNYTHEIEYKNIDIKPSTPTPSENALHKNAHDKNHCHPNFHKPTLEQIAEYLAYLEHHLHDGTITDDDLAHALLRTRNHLSLLDEPCPYASSPDVSSHYAPYVA